MKLPATLLALCTCLPPAQAATPGDGLGRLFFSPAERMELDRIRVGIQDSADASRTVRLDGIVQQNNQPPVLWINGTRYQGRDIAGASIANRNLSASTLVVSMPPPQARDMVLKVGQTLDPAGGNLREVYQRPPQELNQLLQLLSRRSGTSQPQATEAKDKKTAKPAPTKQP